MARLKTSERAKLPNRAFAHIDSSGRRLLPINDEAHVRNALARFDRVAFDDDAARERARKRLLNAAKRYGIVPVGFITGQLQAERIKAARSTDLATLPTGFVTFLLTDIEDSTAVLRELGDGYANVLRGVRRIVRQAVLLAGGREVDARADEFFAVFARHHSAVEAAVVLQRKLHAKAWPGNIDVRVRAGIHSGRPTLTDTGYIGMSVHTAARVCSAAHGGQIVLSGDTKAAVGGSMPAGVRLRSLGRRRLPGMTHAEALFQVEAEGLAADFPPLRSRGTSNAKRRG